VVYKLWLVVTLAALSLCAACASGDAPVTLDAPAALPGDGTISFPDSGPWPGDGPRPTDSNGVSPDKANPLTPDVDKDGHCSQGTPDPGGVCASFNDCDDNDPKRFPGAPETCADIGVDNDCDTDAAEVTGLGAACVSGLPGVCVDGKQQCDQGQLKCAPTITVGQQPEVCNGQDDDCNGQPDDGNLCTNGNTCQGAAGCRCGSAAACSGAAQCCGNACLNLSLDPGNCGACGVSCGPGEACDGGRCRCGSTLGAPGGGKVCTSGSCNSGACTVCNPSVNLAPQASASSSGGGTAADYVPAQMNNGLLQSSCKFHWIKATSTPAGKWIQYSWGAPVSFNYVWFDSSPLAATCSAVSGRSLAGGMLQYWSGSSWVTLKSASGKTDNWDLSFSTVTTTKLRLYNAVATSATGFKQNPVIFEWRVFCK
jgi:Putative metal-binding motif